MAIFLAVVAGLEIRTVARLEAALLAVITIVPVITIFAIIPEFPRLAIVAVFAGLALLIAVFTRGLAFALALILALIAVLIARLTIILLPALARGGRPWAALMALTIRK
ncbi:hypothetical protein GT370_06100 [Acidocella sp. MX-AZ03]|nr:hypothetical protein [Acidocella sp. MX-AZ03]WBO61269.1 hypothetical protein GT370_06100 [Acidocella sp. MX-AZ03]